MKILIYAICFVTLNVAALIISGNSYYFDAAHVCGLIASNIFLASCFLPKYHSDRSGQWPAVFAASTFSALALIASIGWYLRLAFIPSQIALAVEIVAVGLFLATHVALASARRTIGEHGDPRAQPSAQELVTQSALSTIDAALSQIGGSRANTTTAALENISRQIRRKEISSDILLSPSVQDGFKALKSLISMRANAGDVENAAQNIIAKLQD